MCYAHGRGVVCSGVLIDDTPDLEVLQHRSQLAAMKGQSASRSTEARLTGLPGLLVPKHCVPSQRCIGVSQVEARRQAGLVQVPGLGGSASSWKGLGLVSLAADASLHP